MDVCGPLAPRGLSAHGAVSHTNAAQHSAAQHSSARGRHRLTSRRRPPPGARGARGDACWAGCARRHGRAAGPGAACLWVCGWVGGWRGVVMVRMVVVLVVRARGPRRPPPPAHTQTRRPHTLAAAAPRSRTPFLTPSSRTPAPPRAHTHARTPQTLSPTLTFLRNGDAAEQLDAVTLLGSICEKRPGAAAFLVAEGALPPVAKLVASSGAWRVCVCVCVCALPPVCRTVLGAAVFCPKLCIASVCTAHDARRA
jgi:hypothetical protein